MSLRLVKLAAALQQKKFRNKEQLFVAEGEKLVLDLLSDFEAKHILCLESWATEHPDIKTTVISEALLKKATGLKHPSSVLALFKIPQHLPFTAEELPALVLDTLQDPGNLGTIIRTAAWFGIRHIVCSPETVDVYNPKVIQATMGALARVQIHYQPLAPFLKQLQAQRMAIYGTFLEGASIYQTKIPAKSVIVIGNEGQGISEEIRALVSHPIHIPAGGEKHPESLNASVSAAIVCSEIARELFKVE